MSTTTLPTFAPTPAPTASIQTQVQVTISYTFTSIAVAYFIVRLALSVCKKPKKETVEASNDDLNRCCCCMTTGDKIIFWSSFVTICMFFYRSILIWGGMTYHLATDDDNAGDNFAFSISFFGYALGTHQSIYVYIQLLSKCSGLWVMLYTFVARIDYTFRGSYLAYSVNTIRALYAFVFFILLLVFVLVVYEFADRYDAVVGWLLPLILSVHFLFFVVVSSLLFSKIFILIRKKVHQSDDANKDQEKTVDVTDAIDLGNIDSFTRFGLLMSIGISSTYVFTVINAITLGLENEHPIREWGVGYSLVGADLFVNALIVYLLFPMNTGQYNLCCSLCHGCCRKCCMNCVYANMKRNNATDKNKEQFMELILADNDHSDQVAI